MRTSTVAAADNLVETTMFRHARTIAAVAVNSAFALVSVVYLALADRTWTGTAFFGVLLVWSTYRLVTRRDRFLIWDASFVVVGAALQPQIISAEIAQNGFGPTRVIVYPVLLASGVVLANRQSFGVMLALLTACIAGDVLLLGYPKPTVVSVVLLWAAAVGVRRLIRRSAEAIEEADAEARDARLRDEVATARTRFEREQYALLHDTAGSTLMLIGDGSRLDPERIVAQAARDVEILGMGPQMLDPERSVDLVERLTAVSQEARTPVSVDSDTPVYSSTLIAAAAAAATREALNNIDRHARASRAVIAISPGRIAISDDGVGCDEHCPPGFGIRCSIDARMRQVGGTGKIVSSPGRGTTVELTWTEAAPEAMRLPKLPPALRAFQYGLGFAMLVMATQMLVVGFGGLGGVTSVLAGVLVAVLFASSGLATVLAGRAAAYVRWTAVVTVGVLGVSYASTMTTAQKVPLPNWVSVAVGWAMVVLLAGWVGTRRRMYVAVAVIGVYWVVRIAIRLSQHPTNELLQLSGYGLASGAIMQIAVIICAWALSDALRLAEGLAEERHRIVVSRTVAEALQRDYRRRFATTTAVIRDLLRGVASGALRVDDPSVRARARLEYSRLRQLLVKVDADDHPLVQAIWQVCDAAAERGVEVTFEATARPPELDARIAAELREAIAVIIGGARTRVRVTLVTEGKQSTLSVVADCDAAALETLREQCTHCDVQLTADGNVVWLWVRTPIPAHT